MSTIFLKLYLIAVPVFFVLDLLWLGLVARGFYQKQIGFLLKESVSWPAAMIFYLLFVAGLVLFVIWPAVETGSWIKALALGAIFGLVTYAAYDLTNLATIKDWPLLVTVVDLIWGAVLGAIVSVITYFLFSFFN
ncbi:MAG: DUF2177 family protein [Patescibacteria group bacterium]